MKTNRQALFVGNFLSHCGGSRQVCEEIAVRLPTEGWRALCTSSKPNPVARLANMMWTAWRNRSDYSVAHVDVFSGRSFRWAEAVCWTLRRADRPYVLSLHGGNLPAFASRHPRRVSRLLQSAVSVTAPSGYLAERMRAYCADVLLLPNALELGEYDFILRKRLRPKLIWLRGFRTIYNPPLAVRVLKLLTEQFANVHLTMIGPDSGDGSLRETHELAMDLEVLDRSVFCGRVGKNDVPNWLNRGDVFLNTTNVDNTPVSVVEAMACGLCIVSTDVGGIPHLLQHEHDALLVPPNDPVAMAAAVTRILSDPALAERLSRNARKNAEQRDWSVVLPRWNSLLSSVAERRH